jgi:hypothetical protein
VPVLVVGPSLSLADHCMSADWQRMLFLSAAQLGVS